jgi:SAM-dependent methyltransferase
VTGGARLALRSPVTGRPLLADTRHSLAAHGERWPVLDGIPYLRTGRQELAAAALDRLDRGDAEAAAVLLLADQDDWARTPPPDEAARRRVVQARAGLSFREAMDLLAFGPVGTYFAHRWSDPTFLSGLALAEAHRGAGPVLELACGAGHFLREFARVTQEAAGGDVVFAKLWLARHWVAPAAELVCFDAASPWPFPDGAFATLFCHDAFYFLPEKPHVAAEMRRVAPRVLVGHAHNALVDNLSAGQPLTPDGYAALFEAPLLYDDRELTAALIEARAPRPARAAELAGAAAVSLASGAGVPRAVAGGLALPSPGAALRRNPLYRDGRIRFPSERYAAEYGPLVTYPADAEGPESAIAGSAPAIDELARRRVLLDLPRAW